MDTDKELLKILVALNGMEMEEKNNRIFFYRNSQHGRVYDQMNVPNTTTGITSALSAFTARELKK